METINVDFNNADSHGRVRLNKAGAIESISEKNIELVEGKQVELHDEDSLRNVGTLKFSKEENIWVAEIDWKNFIHN
jgi:hypothetical protein